MRLESVWIELFAIFTAGGQRRGGGQLLLELLLLLVLRLRGRHVGFRVHHQIDGLAGDCVRGSVGHHPFDAVGLIVGDPLLADIGSVLVLDGSDGAHILQGLDGLDGILAFDIWGDAVAVKKEQEDLFTSLTKEDWYFSFGPSIRFCIQQFPLRLLFANTCKFRDGEFYFTDQDGDGDYNWKSNWHFVLSFNLFNR